MLNLYAVRTPPRVAAADDASEQKATDTTDGEDWLSVQFLRGKRSSLSLQCDYSAAELYGSAGARRIQLALLENTARTGASCVFDLFGTEVYKLLRWISVMQGWYIGFSSCIVFCSHLGYLTRMRCDSG